MRCLLQVFIVVIIVDLRFQTIKFHFDFLGSHLLIRNGFISSLERIAWLIMLNHILITASCPIIFAFFCLFLVERWNFRLVLL